MFETNFCSVKPINFNFETINFNIRLMTFLPVEYKTIILKIGSHNFRLKLLRIENCQKIAYLFIVHFVFNDFEYLIN